MNRRYPAQQPPAPRRAFSLVESLIALGIFGILAVAMGGAVALATRALPAPGPAARAVQDRDVVMARMLAELRYATAISSFSATGINFAVPDRDGNSTPESVSYRYDSGTLYRTDSNGEQAVLKGLTAFSLAVDTEVRSAPATTMQERSAPETLLSSFNGWPGISASTRTEKLTKDDFVCQYFKIDRVKLPDTLTELTITRVRMLVRTSSILFGPSMMVGIYYPGSPPFPGTQQIGSTTTTSVTLLPLLSSTTWTSFNLSGVTLSSPPTNGLAIVLRGSETLNAQVVYLHNNSAPVDNSVLLWSSNAGESWTPTSDTNRNDAYYEVYGTYRWNDPSTTSVNVAMGRRVEVSLTVEGREAAYGATLLNTPQVLP